MKRLFIFVVFIVALFIVLPTLAEACDPNPCETVQTIGYVWIDTDQYQNLFTEIPNCYNYAATYGSGFQDIEAYGVGDETTSVSVEGQLIQFQPYEINYELPLGEATHSGESYMNIYGAAGTDSFCQELSVDIISERNFDTYTAMGANSMNSSMCANAHLDADLHGASGTLGFGAVNEQVHTYTLEREDGAWQQGMVRTLITSGTLPE